MCRPKRLSSLEHILVAGTSELSAVPISRFPVKPPLDMLFVLAPRQFSQGYAILFGGKGTAHRPNAVVHKETRSRVVFCARVIGVTIHQRLPLGSDSKPLGGGGDVQRGCPGCGDGQW